MWQETELYSWITYFSQYNFLAKLRQGRPYNIKPITFPGHQRLGQPTRLTNKSTLISFLLFVTKSDGDKLWEGKEKEIPILPWFQMQLPLQLMVGFWSSARGRRQGGVWPIRASHITTDQSELGVKFELPIKDDEEEKGSSSSHVYSERLLS